MALRLGIAVLLALAASRAPAATLRERGAYVALAADCTSCHSAAGGAPYAGGEPLVTPFGSIAPPNITPDRETGIGSWTERDFDRAVRRGVRKDGAFLYPAMPYLNYAGMSDADLHALWAYVRSLPAVSHTVPPNTFRFPFNLRPGLAVWQALYFKPQRFTPHPDKSAAWNRGAYLVQVLGHCEACHTPKNLAQAPKASSPLTGGQIEGWYAPDISNDRYSVLRTLGRAGVAGYLRTGRAAGNEKAFGPMQDVVHTSLSHLTAADIDALATYLTEEPPPARSQVPAAMRLSAERRAAGRAVYATHCESCHRADGRGVPGTAPALANNPALTAPDPSNVLSAVLQGFPPQGLWRGMGAFASVLDDQAVADVTNYVRTAWGNSGPPNATPWSIESYRALVDTQAPNPRPATLCPTLPPEVLGPALADTAASLRRAALSDAEMKRLLQDYATARPGSSAAERIEALSTAYCRAVTTGDTTENRAGTQVVQFAARLARVLAEP
jgi:mono/diheme cytochrome c family protein